MELKLVKLGAYTKSRDFLAMIKKYWFLPSTAQERTNATVKLGDASFAQMLDIFNYMTRRPFWAHKHYKLGSISYRE